MSDYLKNQPVRFKRLLEAIQTRFPVAEHPFDLLAEEHGIEPEAIRAWLTDLTERGILRQIGPVFEPRKLGYVSTLIAAQVPESQIDPFVAFVNGHPGVSHNYARAHQLNVWLTLTVPAQAAIGQFIADLKTRFSLDRIHSLPTVRMFKLNVRFSLSDEPIPATAPVKKASTGRFSQHYGPKTPLVEWQMELVRLLQNGLPFVEQPYLEMAQAAGLKEQTVLSQIDKWLETGVVRRMAARVKHQHLGYHENGMVVFDLPDDQIEAAGHLLAELACVSHCYQRPPVEGWPFVLFAMTHCRTPEELDEIVGQMVDRLNPRHHDILKSVCEYKKEPVRFFVEPGQ